MRSFVLSSHSVALRQMGKMFPERSRGENSKSKLYIINVNTDELNSEALDALEYQK